MKGIKKTLVYGAILVIMAVIICGCGQSDTTAVTTATSTSAPVGSVSSGGSEPASTASPVAAQPQYGGVLKIIQTGSVTNLSHVANADSPTDWGYSRPALETLIGLDPSGKYYPRLATDWKIAEDGTSITFNLRQGVKYHDGTEFNAQSVKDCLEIAKGGVYANLKSVSSIDVVDDDTVRLNLPKMDWAVLSSLATAFVGQMVSPTALKTQTKDYLFTHPVGTGPFKFESYTRDVSLKYTRFDDYWGGKPYLDGVEYSINANTTTALMSFKAGEGQIYLAAGAKDFDELKQAGYIVYTGMPGPVTMYFDSSNPESPFSDIKVRRAFCYALDNAALADSLGYGYFEGATQVYSKNHYAYNPAITGYPYDPDKARQLLSEAGYPEGFKTQVIMVSGGSQDLQISMQDYLKRIGIDMAITTVTLPKFSEHSVKGWDGVITGLGARPSVDPCQAMKNSHLSLGNQFVSTARIPELDDLYLKACAEINSDKKLTMIRDLCKMMVDDYCLDCNIYFSPSQDNTSVRTTAVQDANLQLQWWTLEKAWLKK